MKYYAAIDIGTTNIKCAIFKEENGELSLCDKLEHECGLIHPSALEVEQDALLWWDTICKMLKTFSAHYEITAVGISSQGITIVPVDKNNEPLHNAISWLDKRHSNGRLAAINRISKRRFRGITARQSHDDYGIAKISWLLYNKPEIVENTHMYLMPMDFIIAKLCGNWVTDHSMAAGTAAYSIKNKRWSKTILNTFRVPTNKLPTIQISGTEAGHITTSASKQTGLKEGTIVAIGAQDQKCGALGVGFKKGVAALSMGTAFALSIKLDEFVQTQSGFIPIFAGILGEGYQWEACIATGGEALQWIGRLFDMSSETMSDLVADYTADEHSPYFFPHLLGCYHPRMYPNACGGFYNLFLATDKVSMIYAVMEGVAFSLNQNIVLAKAAGEQIDDIYAYGGGSRSDSWLQLLADVSGIRIHALVVDDASCIGAAMLAAMACGVSNVYHENKFRRVFEPDFSKHAILQQRFKAFNKIEELTFGNVKLRSDFKRQNIP